ncbi:MAG: collagenase [Psychrobium sp.]|nr:collagenase [Psychrobium sp.]
MYKKHIIMLACSLALTCSFATAADTNGNGGLKAPLNKLKPLSKSSFIKSNNSEIYAPVSKKIHGAHTKHDNVSRVPNKLMTLSDSSKAAGESACDGYSDMANMTGEALFNFIRISNTNCISELYQKNDAVAVAVYNASKVIDVAQRAETMATMYDSRTGDEMNKLFYFLRGAFYIEYYNDDLTYTDQGPKNALANLLTAYSENPYFLDLSDNQADTLAEYFITWDSSGNYYDSVSSITAYLKAFSPEYLSSYGHRNALTKALTTLYRGNWDATYTKATEEYTELLNALIKIATSEYIYNSDFAYESTDAFHEFGRFLEYQQYWDLSEALKTRLNDGIIQYMNNFERMSAQWVDAAGYLEYYNAGECEKFGICGWKDELENSVLSINYSCSDTINIRAQQLTNTELQASCELMGTEEKLFHNMLTTNNQPVADDLNSNLEVNIFNSYDDYKQFAGVIFGIGTDNGGMYLEGDPSQEGNQARFIAHEATWTEDILVWNLRHEYVHYLDGRFNLYGGFNHFDSTTGKSVWWSEGLAEYISHQNRYDDAITLGRNQTHTLSEILANNYSSGSDRVYKWGYLAVRFMFENYRGDVDQLLSHGRNGDVTAWLAFINDDIGSNYDAQWLEWLLTVTSNDEPLDGDVTIPPTEPTECTEDACDPSKPDLVDGITKVGIDGKPAYFTIWVPAGTESIRFSTQGGTGDANIYVKAGSWATANDFTYSSVNVGNDETVTITDVTADQYYYVTLDSDTSFEGVNLLPEFNVSTVPTEPTECIEDACDPSKPDLVDGITKVSIDGGQAYFVIWVPAGTESIRFTTQGGTGDANIYAKAGSWATADDFTYSSVNVGNNEIVTITDVTGDQYYYVTLDSDTSFDGVNLLPELNVSTAPTEPLEPINKCIELGCQTLESGVDVKRIKSDSQVYFSIFVPKDVRKVKFRMKKGKGEADMYISRGSLPTADEYDFANIRDRKKEKVVIRNPEGGEYYYIMLKAREGNFKVRLKAVIFE